MGVGRGTLRIAAVVMSVWTGTVAVIIGVAVVVGVRGGAVAVVVW